MYSLSAKLPKCINPSLGWRLAGDAAFLAFPPQTMGDRYSTRVKSGFSCLWTKIHSTNSADSHHALSCILILYGYFVTYLHRVTFWSILRRRVDHQCVCLMPTPRDSTDHLPLLLERPTHTTCPPEEDRPGQWRVEVLDRLGRAALDSTIGNRALRQQDGVPVEAESPEDMVVDLAHDKTSDQINTMDLSEASLFGESPSSPHADDKEMEHVQPAAPTSSALDLYYSIRVGIESNRVSIFELYQFP